MNQRQLAFRDKFKLIIISVIILFCIGGIFCLQKSRLNIQKNPPNQNYLKQEQEQKLRLNLLNYSPSFGFNNLIADWAFLNFIQYYGDAPAREKTGNSLSPNYFEAVVKNDPRFIDAYFLLASATSLFAGHPQKSVDLISKGLEYVSPNMPLAYQLWTYKAVDELLFLGDTEAAKKSYQMAAQWARYQNDEMSRLNGARAAETAQFLATNPDSKRAQVGAWLMIFGNARDEQTRQEALRRIEALGGKVTITPGKVSVQMPEENEESNQ